MSKKITQKLKEQLTPEDLKIFESAMETMIAERVKAKVGDLVALKEEELKKKYDTISENYVVKEVNSRIDAEKANLVETYDKKLNNLEKKVVAKLDSFLEHVIIEQISDKALEKLALNETLLPVVNKIKAVFSESHIEVDSEGEKIVKDLTEAKEKSDKLLSEEIAKRMETEERLEKSAIFLMISEKTNGLKNTDKKRVVEMFKDKKFDEVSKKIDGFVLLIKEGDVAKIGKKKLVKESKVVENLIDEKDGLDEPKKTVIKEDVEDNTYSLTEVANTWLNK